MKVFTFAFKIAALHESYPRFPAKLFSPCLFSIDCKGDKGLLQASLMAKRAARKEELMFGKEKVAKNVETSPLLCIMAGGQELHLFFTSCQRCG